MNWLVIGLVIFLGVHAFSMLRGPREALISGLGSETVYKGVYALLALAGLLLVVIGFSQYRATGMIPLWNPPAWGRHIAMLTMLLAFISFVASYVPSHIRSTLKHPMIIAVSLWALSHLLANGDLGSVVMFGSFLIWGVTARISMGRRARAIFATPSHAAPTGFRNDLVVVLLGVLLFAAMVTQLHQSIIGVPIIAM
jgi:uncharacterized membrane protein